MNVLDELTQVLAARRDAAPESSYVASLHHAGLNRILEKVGEEATEVIVAAKDAGSSGNTDDLVKEIADLWFHSMVLLSHLNTDASAVLAVLESRFGTSGHVEKRSRGS